jgi:hypothetical protein
MARNSADPNPIQAAWPSGSTPLRMASPPALSSFKTTPDEYEIELRSYIHDFLAQRKPEVLTRVVSVLS